MVDIDGNFDFQLKHRAFQDVIQGYLKNNVHLGDWTHSHFTERSRLQNYIFDSETFAEYLQSSKGRAPRRWIHPPMKTMTTLLLPYHMGDSQRGGAQ